MSHGTVAITGATGFLGRALASRLTSGGWSVRSIVRPHSPRRAVDGTETVVAGLSHRELAEAFDGCTVVIHLAGLTRGRSFEEYARVNRDGAGEAALGAREAGARMVLVSSQAAGGTGTASNPRSEDDPSEPMSDYGRSKLAGERAMAEVPDLEWSIVRPVSVYGPGDRDFAALYRAAARGLGPLVNPPGTPYSLIHVDDLVRGLIAVIENDAALGELFYLAHPEIATSESIVRAFAAAAGRQARLFTVPRWGLRLATEAAALAGRVRGRPGLLTRSRYREITAPGFVCSSDKIRRHLGFEATIDLVTGARLSRDWYLQDE